MSKERLTKRHGELVGCPQNIECTSICDDCDHMGKMMNKLAEYEDLEERNLLLRLPCNIGDAVWVVVEVYTFGETEDDSDSWYTIYTTKFGLNMLDMFGKTVFLTQSEAEEKLRELEGK